jgi:hypothetical protein
MQISPELKKILIIVLVVVALGGVVATGVAVTRSIFSKASDIPEETVASVPKLAPPKTPSKTATPAAAPKPVSSTPTPATPSAGATPTTTVENGWTTYGTGLVSAVLSFSTDYQNLYVDFASSSFAVVSSIDYSLTYEDSAATVRLIRGTVVPSGGTIARKVIALGTCSGTTCTYDAGAHNFVFRMLTKTNGGLTVNLKTYSLAALPTVTVLP